MTGIEVWHVGVTANLVICAWIIVVLRRRLSNLTSLVLKQHSLLEAMYAWSIKCEEAFDHLEKKIETNVR